MLKQTKFEDKTVKSTQPSPVLIGLHDFLIFSNRTAHAWSVEAGNICSVSVFFVRVGSQISPRRAKKDSNIPSPGRTRSVKCPTPGPTKTIKSPPHALPPPPPAGFTLIGAWDYRSQSILQKHQKAAERAPGGNPYKGLYGETPHERGNFFQVFKRVGISLVFGL